MGWKHTPESKAKIAASLRKTNGTPEARAAIGQRAKVAMTAYQARVRAALAAMEQQDQPQDGQESDHG